MAGMLGDMHILIKKEGSWRPHAIPIEPEAVNCMNSLSGCMEHIQNNLDYLGLPSKPPSISAAVLGRYSENLNNWHVSCLIQNRVRCTTRKYEIPVILQKS